MIISLDIIKDEVGRLDDLHDEMIQRKLTEAEAIVIDYLKIAADFYGGAGLNDFPALEAAAVISVARILYETPDEDPLSMGVKNILHRLRDPAMA